MAKVADRLDRELGAQLGYSTSTTVAKYLETCQLEDFLDALTLIHDALRAIGYSRVAGEWTDFVERVFREENTSYRIAADGGVHYRVDREFAINIGSSLSAISNPRYAQVHAAFERARVDMEKTTPDALDAIRNVFEAAESLFKIVTGVNRSLDEGEVRKTLVPFVDRKMKDADAVAKRSAAAFITGFADWVNAAHPYRHGHDEVEAVIPPLHIGVAMISGGAAYIRWIATLDQL